MSNIQETWRFINSGFLDGAANMAIDVALARCMSSHSHYPVLRVYGWNPAAISLGYHQNIKDIDVEKCRQDGIDIVYRPTGGRAILHADELTYSVIIPESSAYFHNDIHNVYETISLCLVSGLRLLNLNAVFERASDTPKDFSRGELSTMCYASTVQNEISFNGKKLVGSAQRRYDGVVLQHGSILIGRKHLDIADYLVRGDENWRSHVKRFLEGKTISLNEMNHHTLTFADLAPAVNQGFVNELNIKFIDTELTERELHTAQQIKEEQSY